MINKLLVIEDDPGLRSQLRWCFENFEVLQAEDTDSALAQLRKHEPAIITLDLGLPPDPGGVSVGFSLLEKIRIEYPASKIIVITGQEDRENALKAVEMGAYDFFQKPVDPGILPLVVDRAFYLYQVEQENKQLLAQKMSSPLDGIITASPGMLKICEQVEKIAPSDLSVLIIGESGTGKEVIARAVHQLSLFSGGKFVAINCSAIPENLLESELFGHEKGSFTGAIRQKKGKIEIADGGTLFLDEIGDMPLELQAKLLRFLQERVIERVGGTNEISIDARVICATNKNIIEIIESKEFREDLYYRISDIVIKLPPLRDRDDDIILLSQAFLEKYAREQGKRIVGLSRATQNILSEYPFKGNVRELEKIIRRAVIMAEEDYIQPKDLQIDDNLETSTIIENGNDELSLAFARNAAEKRAIIKALEIENGNISKSAKLLDISRPTLYSLIERLNINKNS